MVPLKKVARRRGHDVHTIIPEKVDMRSFAVLRRGRASSSEVGASVDTVLQPQDEGRFQLGTCKERANNHQDDHSRMFRG